MDHEYVPTTYQPPPPPPLPSDETNYMYVLCGRWWYVWTIVVLVAFVAVLAVGVCCVGNIICNHDRAKYGMIPISIGIVGIVLGLLMAIFAMTPGTARPRNRHLRRIHRQMYRLVDDHTNTQPVTRQATMSDDEN